MQRKISAESPSPGFAEKLVEGITRTTHRADRVALASVGKRFGETADMDIDGRLRIPTQKKEALEYGAGQHYVHGVPRCGLSSTADVHTEEAWCRIRRSPDHSLAGAFLFCG
jgi:hypothetical protein